DLGRVAHPTRKGPGIPATGTEERWGWVPYPHIGLDHPSRGLPAAAILPRRADRRCADWARLRATRAALQARRSSAGQGARTRGHRSSRREADRSQPRPRHDRVEWWAVALRLKDF